MNIKQILILLLCIVIFPLSAKEKLAKNFKFGADLYINTDSEDYLAEYYTLGGKLRFYFEPVEDMELKAEFKADGTQAEFEELRLKYSFEDSELKFGMYKNKIFSDDKLNSVEHPFSLNSLLIQRAEDMGWYSTDGLGFSYDQDLGDRLKGSATAILDSAMYCPMATALLDYEIDEINTSVGLSASYIYITTPHNPEAGYYLFNTYISNTDEDNSWNYKAEFAFGKNIGDPGGETQYAQAYEETSYYLGADGFLSYRIPFNKDEEGEFANRVIPAAGVGYMMWDLDKPKSSSTDVKIGGTIDWNESLYIKAEGGLRTNVYYYPDLTTGLEWIWALDLRYRY